MSVASLAASVFAGCHGRFQEIPVDVCGSWTCRTRREYANPVTGNPPLGPYVDRTYISWDGNAEACRPILALVYAETRRELRWAKCEKRIRTSLSLFLGTFVLGEPSKESIWVGWRCEEGGVSTALVMNDLDARRRTAALAGPNVATGLAFDLMQLEGDPPLVCGAVFFVRDDVRFTRGGLWRIRQDVAATMGEPLATILTRGRTGVVRATASPG